MRRSCHLEQEWDAFLFFLLQAATVALLLPPPCPVVGHSKGRHAPIAAPVVAELPYAETRILSAYCSDAAFVLLGFMHSWAINSGNPAKE